MYSNSINKIPLELTDDCYPIQHFDESDHLREKKFNISFKNAAKLLKL